MTPDQLRIEAKIRELNAYREASVRARRELEVRNALLDYHFSNQQMRNDVRTLITAKVHAEPDEPVEAIVQREISKMPSWQKQLVAQDRPIETVQTTEHQNRPADGSSFDIDNIHPGMSKADAEKARLAIVAALPPQHRGRY